MSDDAVILTLRPLISASRAERIERAIRARLKGVAVLLEGLYDHGNTAAVMRTAEAFGVHRVHLVSLPGPYKEAKKIGQGAQKWLDVHLHTDPERAARALRDAGYRLVGSHLEATHRLADLAVDRPLALAFGNEHRGLSPELLALCDETFHIPMAGYTQSLNVSCAAAICIADVTRRYRLALGHEGDLDEAEAADLREMFYRRAVRWSDLVLGDGGGDGER